MYNYVEDSVFEDGKSITNNREEKQPVKEDHNIDEESINEESVVEEKNCVADGAEKEKAEVEGATFAGGRNDAAATNKSAHTLYTTK